MREANHQTASRLEQDTTEPHNHKSTLDCTISADYLPEINISLSKNKLGKHVGSGNENDKSALDQLKVKVHQ